MLAAVEARARMTGVPVRVEQEALSRMSGATHREEQLATVEERPATEDDYDPPKGFKRAEAYECFQ